MLRYSLGLTEEAAALERAVQTVLEQGHRTADIAAADSADTAAADSAGAGPDAAATTTAAIGTAAMGDLIARAIG